MRFEGRLWLFGDNIDTDNISPGKFLNHPLVEQLPHVLKNVRPEFAEGVKSGDILVGGKNFGCGSSREQAPQALRKLGISVIVARTFARIFHRNAMAIGLPVVVLDEEHQLVDGAVALVDIVESYLRSDEKTYRLRPTPAPVIELMRVGGVLPALRELGRRQQAEAQSATKP